VSNAIAAIHHVLYNYESEERDENMAIREIASAIRPFEPGYSVYRLVLGTPGKPPQRAFESGPFNQPVSMVLEVAR